VSFDHQEWLKIERALIVAALNVADHPQHSHARTELEQAARRYREYVRQATGSSGEAT